MALACPNCNQKEGFLGHSNRDIGVDPRGNPIQIPIFKCKSCGKVYSPEEINEHNKVGK